MNLTHYNNWTFVFLLSERKFLFYSIVYLTLFFFFFFFSPFPISNSRIFLLNSHILRSRLIQQFKQYFSIFKQHYTYFHTLFHPHVFPKNTNNVTKRPLSFFSSLFDLPLSHSHFLRDDLPPLVLKYLQLFVFNFYIEFSFIVFITKKKKFKN